MTPLFSGYYKFSENGRRICTNQRNILLKCLNDLAKTQSSDPEERMGSIILFMSCVFQHLMELLNCLVMVTFFDIVDCDSTVKELVRDEGF
ncbi:hypothetical protein OESDEN_17676 [Oesophagostomum dentatum]|uniref:Uncharacterized protein n=1 Tax=Oesophagostomum dentatum TaxID=61180 RepID=A0A0B1SHK0_OESDE|nr:hypothetical protein OESDEN_17676 [Oesophagostomum dentatum]